MPSEEQIQQKQNAIADYGMYIAQYEEAVIKNEVKLIEMKRRSTARTPIAPAHHIAVEETVEELEWSIAQSKMIILRAKQKMAAAKEFIERESNE